MKLIALGNYNSDINIIGSIPDYHLIYSALPFLIENPEKLNEILIINNEFDFRTEKSRKRFLTVLRSAFVNSQKDINELISLLLLNLKNDESSLSLILFWVFSVNNKLFFELNRDVFLTYYFQGRAELPKEAVTAYIKDLIIREPELKGKWSEKTIITIASKYLTILKKLKLVEGSQKKKFILNRISDEQLTIFIHLIGLLEDRKTNFLDNEFLLFTFISKENVLGRLKRLGKKDLIKLNFNGVALEVESVYNKNTIIDGLFRRA